MAVTSSSEDVAAETPMGPQPQNDEALARDREITEEEEKLLEQYSSSLVNDRVSKEQEKEKVKELESTYSRLVVGDTWYLIDAKWFQSWQGYVNYYRVNNMESPRPGEIDNSTLIDPTTGVLKKHASEQYDFVPISAPLWLQLKKWYGNRGVVLPRKVINTKPEPKIEVRPLSLKIIRTGVKEEDPLNVSKATSVAEFRTLLCNKYSLEESKVRVWDYHGYSKLKDLGTHVPELTLERAQIIDNQCILIEIQNEDGTWPAPPPRPATIYSGSTYSYYSSTPVPPEKPGLVGLTNLGNTCFMNSAIQCLGNCFPLSCYFLNQHYVTDINIDNPLGMKGELAQEYYSLLQEMWDNPTANVVAPRNFKFKLSRFAPQFEGYQQHDSQELLAFLLDGLHEDLNRVRKKPFVESKESDGRPDEVVAQEAWGIHTARNDSFVVDWFQGQLKSTLKCPNKDCAKVAVTFDPMMYLSLPMPFKTTRVIHVTLFFLDPSRPPTKFAAKVTKFGQIHELKAALAELAGIKDKESIVLLDVYNSRFYKKFQSNATMDEISERDTVHGHEVLLPSSDSEEVANFPILSRKEEVYQYHNYSNARSVLFGIPHILSVAKTKNITVKELREKILAKLHRFIKPQSPEKTEKMEADDEKENDPEKEKEKEAEDPMFTLKISDEYGFNDRATLKDDEEVVDVADKTFIIVHWSARGIKEMYEARSETDFAEHPSVNTQEDSEESELSIYKCIEMFNQEEQLGAEDTWYCNRCKEHQQAFKKFDLWRLPPILVVHLKRFSYKNRYYREKVETNIDFPLEGLDFSKYLLKPTPPNEPPIYDLFAITNHFGSLGGGHYTAYAKNRETGKWYNFDDSRVSEVTNLSSMKTSAAYVLFYARRDLKDWQPPPRAVPPAGSNNNNNSNTTTNTATNDQPPQDDRMETN